MWSCFCEAELTSFLILKPCQKRYRKTTAGVMNHYKSALPLWYKYSGALIPTLSSFQTGILISALWSWILEKLKVQYLKVSARFSDNMQYLFMSGRIRWACSHLHHYTLPSLKKKKKENCKSALHSAALGSFRNTYRNKSLHFALCAAGNREAFYLPLLERVW